jgi:hypothetical protein
MYLFKLKYAKHLMLLVFLQISTLLVYLNTNIINVGEMGTALPFLGAYIGLSVLVLSFIWLQRRIYLRLHLLLFLLLVAWVSLRVIIDLGDTEYLKQITIATTGGILLFYLLGAFLGVSYNHLIVHVDGFLTKKLVLILFFFLMVWMLFNFSQRLHPRLFYLLEINGSYQRSGNFLSISVIIFSFLYLSLVLSRVGKYSRILSNTFWLIIYTVSSMMAMVGSQLFGSNSATAVILGVYLITLVMSLSVPRKVLLLSYLKGKLALPWSKRLFNRLSFMAIIGLSIFLISLVVAVYVSNFDITKLRLLGFGSGTNTSVQSRIEILMEVGWAQLSYAPFFGNMNVAYLTTGNSGRTLHSFFPYVMANLGLVGLSIVLLLIATALMQLYKESKVKSEVGMALYQGNMIAIYSIFILIYLLIFANLATGVSWIVLWFSLGFVSKPFGFK